MVRKDAVAIVNQESVSLFIPDHLTQVLQRPGGTRMGCDIATDQPAAALLAPPGILVRDPSNQRLNLLGNPRSSGS